MAIDHTITRTANFKSYNVTCHDGTCYDGTFLLTNKKSGRDGFVAWEWVDIIVQSNSDGQGGPQVSDEEYTDQKIYPRIIF